MSKVKNNKKLKYIDLFSGVGGFHQMMDKFGGELVFASEIDAHAISTYDNNYLKGNQTSAIDVTKIKENDISDFDVICAGFPCQTFSKAGSRKGFADQTRGTLFFDIVRIAKAKKPKYLLLENVRNLASHDKGNTWKVIRDTLNSIGYVTPHDPIIISPHNLKVPQLRERVFIPCYFDPKQAGIKWVHIPVPLVDKNSLNPNTIIDDKSDKDPSLKLSVYESMVLSAWDEFYQIIDLKIIGFPVWAEELNSKKVPPELPEWKKIILKKNRDLYNNNKSVIDVWLKKWGVLTEKFVPTHRKMEWQAGNSIKSLFQGIIQFRPSGVRVKRPTVFPTLVAMVQTPILGWKRRYISPREAANLQSFKKSFKIDERPQQAYKQFGNSINVKTAEYIFKELLKISQNK